jgi:hypothetical protein
MTVATLAATPAAPPTTGTTTAPAAELAERDSVEMKSSEAKLSFRVPKAWKRLKSSAPEDIVFVFDPVAGSASKTRRFSVMLGQPCERQKQLAAVVADTRAGISAMSKGAAFVRDEAGEIAGHPAWVFAWPETMTQTVTEVRNGKQSSHTQELKILRQKTIWLQNDTICDIGFTAELSGVAAMQRYEEQIRRSFIWEK